MTPAGGTDAVAEGATPDGASRDLAELAARILDGWHRAGADGAFLARHLGTGEWLGFGQDLVLPVASVIKVPVALVASSAIEAGELDPDRLEDFAPAPGTGPTGLAAFTGPARVSTADLLHLMLAVSDNVAADRILDRIGLTRCADRIQAWGLCGIRLRHPLSELFASATGDTRDDFALALELAITGVRPDGGHRIAVLDARTGNTATARALAELLERIWSDTIETPAATARVRRLMAAQQPSHRLGAELRSDDLRLSAKTGTYLNLRHEIGVVETDDGDAVVLVALTRSSRPAFAVPMVDAAIAAAARDAFDRLRT